jgi:hypothetical protein
MMDTSTAYQQGYNHYWHGGQDCPYEPGTIEHADWWTGWEAAAKGDAPEPEEKEENIHTAKAKEVRIFRRFSERVLSSNEKGR